jgi:hypothetical protein
VRVTRCMRSAVNGKDAVRGWLYVSITVIHGPSQQGPDDSEAGRRVLVSWTSAHVVPLRRLAQRFATRFLKGLQMIAAGLAGRRQGLALRAGMRLRRSGRATRAFKPGSRVKARQDERTVWQCADAPTGQAGQAETHRIPVCESGTTRARRHRRGRNGSCPNPPLLKTTQDCETAGICAGFDRNATSDPRVTGMWNP